MPLGLIFALWGIILASRGIVLGAPGFHFQHSDASQDAFLGLGSNFAENIKIVQKSKFSCGFSLLSGIWRTSKSMKNHEKSTQDCFGTPENHPGWEGLAGLARSVALEKENKGQKGVATLIKLATTVRAQATGKGREGVNPFPGFLG